MDVLASLDYLTDIEASTSVLVKTAVPDELVADVAGRVQHVERTLGQFRRNLLAEQDVDVDGREYGLRSGGRVATRSYNLAAITYSLIDEQTDITTFMEALNELISQQAVKLTFGWQRLQKVFQDHDVMLRVAHHEISDDGDVDGPHVGEVWSEKPMVIVALEEPQ